MSNEFLAELRESARQVVAGEGLAANEDKLWSLISELGWLLTSVPEELDGLGQGLPGTCLLHEELGRGLSTAPFIPAQIAIDAICASELENKSAWLERLASGELVTAPLVDPELDVRETGAVSGTVSAVQSADRAQYLLLWVQEPACVFLLPCDHPGVELEQRRTWDVTRRLFDVRLSDVELDDSLVLARGPNAIELISRIQTTLDFALAADSVGGASALLELTVEHLQTRTQFGRPLALFQSLKHRCADLKMQLAAADALLQQNLAHVGESVDSTMARLAATKAKYLACTVFAKVAEEALQLHGGIGMAVEHSCHLFLKRAMLNEHLGGAQGRYAADIAEAAITW